MNTPVDARTLAYWATRVNHTADPECRALAAAILAELHRERRRTALTEVRLRDALELLAECRPPSPGDTDA
jgi:hypothetical protein